MTVHQVTVPPTLPAASGMNPTIATQEWSSGSFVPVLFFFFFSSLLSLLRLRGAPNQKFCNINERVCRSIGTILIRSDSKLVARLHKRPVYQSIIASLPAVADHTDHYACILKILVTRLVMIYNSSTAPEGHPYIHLREHDVSFRDALRFSPAD